MNTLAAAMLLIRKDLRIELRTGRAGTMPLVLGLLIVAILALGLGVERAPGADGTREIGAAHVLWVAYVFAGVLCFERTMGVERRDDAVGAILLAPIDPDAVYLAKVVTNLVLLLALGTAITLAGVVLFSMDLSAHPWAFARIMALGMIGLAAVGTLFSAALAASRAGGGVLAIVVLPPCLPLVMMSARLLSASAGAGPLPTGGAGEGVLVAVDLLFLAAGWLLFPHLLGAGEPS